MMKHPEWKALLTEVRRKDLTPNKKKSTQFPLLKRFSKSRTESERDYDRILFSTPVRRLSDKTQVFPLEKNDSVRTRLTHSHEVANIARSMGVALVSDSDIFKGVPKANRNVPAILAAVGLAHDIGNPPFGHEGELAIAKWFSDHTSDVFCDDCSEQMKLDYENFEGNAQALRILSKLQIVNDDFGLNLTCASLAALVKYPCASDKRVSDDSDIAKKKFGYFYSEKTMCKEVWEQTGLNEGIRHPLAYIMEAADDIAYSVLDAEDAIKKGLVSYRDLIDHIKDDADESIKFVVEKSEDNHKKYLNEDLHPTELNDISMQMFRVNAVGELVAAATRAFEDNIEDILLGKFKTDLIKVSDAANLCKKLKNFSYKHAYKSRKVLELELDGYKVIHKIMDMLWAAIEQRGNPLNDDTHGGDIFERYAYGLISENYRRIFEDKNNNHPISYKRSQLLADMVSGMTDSFAIEFEQNLTSFKLSDKK